MTLCSDLSLETKGQRRVASVFGKLNFCIPKKSYHQSKQTIGMADGVSGESEESIAVYSGIYPRKLMPYCIGMADGVSGESEESSAIDSGIYAIKLMPCCAANRMIDVKYEAARDVNEEATSEFDNLKLVSGCFYLPKKSESRPLGQDAHFHFQTKRTIGVADGVTGRSERSVAIDSGIYARELMSNCVAKLGRKPNGAAVNPKRVLKTAHFKTVSKGSSTACVVSLNGTRLCYANVGDSGFLVFRSNRCVYTSTIKQRRFNHPYQLNNSGRRIIEFDDIADEGEFEVEAGDVVVLGTDGLLDNLFAHEIEDILEKQISCETPHMHPQQIAVAIGVAAEANSRNDLYKSPFSMAAGLAGFECVGGKYDDITVIVARIESSH
jgi:protein phosphatase PTC7